MVWRSICDKTRCARIQEKTVKSISYDRLNCCNLNLKLLKISCLVVVPSSIFPTAHLMQMKNNLLLLKDFLWGFTLQRIKFIYFKPKWQIRLLAIFCSLRANWKVFRIKDKINTWFFEKWALRSIKNFKNFQYVNISGNLIAALYLFYSEKVTWQN